ncbi:MAG: DUF4178 domain-containing protein [Dinghuibacter sp.]|nr:DUF4178 domain-containing protein [Dinghuibacter sp.]
MALPETNILSCPACKQLVYFSGAGTNLIGCGYCHSFIYRNETGEIKEQSILRILNAASVIQTGATGVWANKTFTVTGRFRTWFNDSVASFFTVQFSDQSIGWLCETNGLYYMYEPVNPAPNEQVVNQLNPEMGSVHELHDGKKYVLHQKNQVFRWEAEGEIYIPEINQGFSIMEFKRGTGSAFSFFIYSNRAYTFRVYPVAYTSLGMQQLRTYSTTAKEFTCTKCHNQVSMAHFPQTQSGACTHCGAFYDIKRGVDAEFTGKSSTNELTTSIPLGAKGTINSVQYEVVGVMIKEEQSADLAQWTEYTLFNAETGFAFLSEYNGNWIFLQEKNNTPVLYRTFEEKLRSNGKEFRLYSKYYHNVLAASGEFPGNVFSNDKTESFEYIAPPEIWNYDRNPQKGIHWYKGRHINTRELTTAFGINTWPAKRGTGIIEPFGLTDTWKIVLATFAGLLLLVAAHGIFALTRQNRQLFSGEFEFTDSSAKTANVTPKFELDKRVSNILLNIWAPVTNNWFELNATLVNAENGKEYSLQQGVEYYSGYSGGEYWKEGSNEQRAWFKSIPRGTYFLQLDGYRDTTSAFPVKRYSVTAIYDVAGNRNFYIPMFIYLGFGLLVVVIGNFRERNRWSGSRFNPYSK